MPYLRLFIFAGILSSAISILHLVIIFLGSEAYLYFGAGEEMADADARGSFIPDLITFVVALVFMAFALYVFSAAKIIRRLPALKVVLIGIASIYVLRGLGIMGDLLNYFHLSNYPFRNIIFSLVSLITGVVYAIAIIKGQSHMSIETKKP